jgi:hypothetical protein
MLLCLTISKHISLEKKLVQCPFCKSDINEGASVCASCNAFKEKQGNSFSRGIGILFSILFCVGIPFSIAETVASKTHVFFGYVVLAITLIAGIWLFTQLLKGINKMQWKRWN